jgi:hypothetical protein
MKGHYKHHKDSSKINSILPGSWGAPGNYKTVQVAKKLQLLT